MRRIPRWTWGVGIRVFVGFWLLFGVVQIWSRVQTLGRPNSGPNPSVTQLASLSQAIQVYILDNGAPPTTEQGLEALVKPPTLPPQPANWSGPYFPGVRAIAPDSWGRPYRYVSPGPNGEPYVVMTYGKDGKPGGVGEDADLSRPMAGTE